MVSRAGRAPRVAADLALVFVGGAAGVAARAGLSLAFDGALVGGGRVGAGSLWGVPIVVIVINVVGSFMLGLLLALLGRGASGGADAGWRRPVRLGLGVGVLGGFTTYSTFAVDVAAAGVAGGVGGLLGAFGVAAVVVVCGALAAWAGLAVGAIGDGGAGGADAAVASGAPAANRPAGAGAGAAAGAEDAGIGAGGAGASGSGGEAR